MQKSMSYVFLFLFKMFTSVLSLFSSSLVFMWLCLELKFYSSLPLLKILKSNSRSKLNFFLIKVLSSFMFLVSCAVKSKFSFVYLSLFLKLSVFPLLWLPLVVSQVNWSLYPTLLVFKKLPGLKIFLKFYTQSKMFNLTLFFVMCLSTAMLIKSMDLGEFLGWSSVTQTSVLMLLCKKIKSFFYYFLIYSLKMFITFYCVSLVKSPFLGVMLFLKSGFPPSAVFFIKIFFFSHEGLSPLFLFLVSGLFFLKFLGYLNMFMTLSFFGENPLSKNSFLSIFRVGGGACLLVVGLALVLIFS